MPRDVSAAAVAAAQKKKGIKSSLGRFFSKKEKVCCKMNFIEKPVYNVHISQFCIILKNNVNF